VQKYFSQTPEQNDWQEFRPLFGGGKIKICDTLRAVTPFGGLSVLLEFFARIGLVEQLENRQFYQPESPNHQSLRSGAGSGWIYVERHCRSAAFRACQPAKGR
jgi:hypothetical protein